MSAVEIIAAAIPVGVWLRWATAPVRISYRVGREAERLMGGGTARGLCKVLVAGYRAGRRDRVGR